MINGIKEEINILNNIRHRLSKNVFHSANKKIRAFGYTYSILVITCIVLTITDHYIPALINLAIVGILSHSKKIHTKITN
jgi:hypothetical protein